MNIIVVSGNPQKCVEFLDDVRLNKFILETAQMLSSACHHHIYDKVWDYKALQKKKYPSDKLYRDKYKKTTGLYIPNHYNHPCTIWVRENKSNYIWTLELFEAMLFEKKYRTGKEHKSIELFDLLWQHSRYFPNGNLTKFANCARNNKLGLDYTTMSNVFEAYKKYMFKRWELDTIKLKWTNRQDPRSVLCAF